jgi:CheY-like chemotaxis protein
MTNKPRILIVEDEAIFAKALQQTMETWGYEVLAPVATGEEAVETARKTNPDVVIMDILLAGEMDGIEATVLIQSAVDAAVIYLTGDSDPTRLQRAHETSPYGCLIKPILAHELKTIIEITLERRRLERRS